LAHIVSYLRSLLKSFSINKDMCDMTTSYLYAGKERTSERTYEEKKGREGERVYLYRRVCASTWRARERERKTEIDTKCERAFV